MSKKTKDYNMFVLRDDNREKIDQTHLKKIIQSIQAKNLLELRPIIVNGAMEVMDGQHRLLAAKHLGVEIYYDVDDSLECHDIIALNVSKNWAIGDYLNYYCKRGNNDYILLRDFIKKNQLHTRSAINLTMGEGKAKYALFREGNYKFDNSASDQEIEICWRTIDFIKKMNGYSSYTGSSRFWKALIKLITHESFYEERWMTNLRKMVERFCGKASTKDYLKMMMEVYNYRNNIKIDLVE